MIQYLKIGGLAAAAIAAIWLTGQLREKTRLEGVERDFKACERSVTKGGEPAASANLSAEAPTTGCPQALSDAVTRARRYLLCDASLKTRDLYGIRSGCSEFVKRRDAEATAAAAEAASLTTALAELKADQAAAIARATARAATSARKDENARQALARAPVSAGRTRCDDQCLRDLTGY